MADEFKALTVVHLPFHGKDGKTFRPGSKITKDDFVKNADGVAAAASANPDGEYLSADELIDYFLEWGTISDDMDAEVHPDHRPVDPYAPTLAGMIENAKRLMDELGDDAPEEIKKLAETKLVSSGDSGSGGEKQ